MGRRRDRHQHLPKSHTLPSSPTHSFSSSSSDFEFTISISPRKSSATLCPADELFYKGQILPLHHSRRLSMVLGSSSDTNTTASRDSTGSSTDSHSSFSSDLSQLRHHPESSRPSSVNEDAVAEDIKCINNNNVRRSLNPNTNKKTSKFSLSRFSSVFRKEPKNNVSSSSAAKRTTSTASAKEVISKYLKRVKPFYEKISQKQQPKAPSSSPTPTTIISSRMQQARSCMKTDGCIKERDIPISAHQDKVNEMNNHNSTSSLHSFAGNMRHKRARSCTVAASCPSSVRSSPNHSRRNEFTPTTTSSCSSSMEELQSAIQGAIAHCKSSMLQNKTIYGQ